MASPTKKTWNRRNARDAKKVQARNKKARAKLRKATKAAAK
jgi:hypothetical protein